MPHVNHVNVDVNLDLNSEPRRYGDGRGWARGPRYNSEDFPKLNPASLPAGCSVAERNITGLGSGVTHMAVRSGVHPTRWSTATTRCHRSSDDP